MQYKPQIPKKKKLSNTKSATFLSGQWYGISLSNCSLLNHCSRHCNNASLYKQIKSFSWETFSHVTCLNASGSCLWKCTLCFSPLLVQKVREVWFHGISGTLHDHAHIEWHFCTLHTTHILLKLWSGITKKRNIEHSFGWGEPESPAARESNYCYGRLSFGLDIGVIYTCIYDNKTMAITDSIQNSF